MIESKAVALRLEAGSQQAGYLAAFCPFDATPFLAVIQYDFPTYSPPLHRPHWLTKASQGQVEERFTSGITKNDFTRKLLFALNRKGPAVQQQQPLGPTTTADAAAAVASTEQPTSAPETPAAEPGARAQDTSSAASAQPSTSASSTPDPQTSNPTTASLYADRRARLEGQQRAERAQTAERARIRRQEEEQAAASNNPNTLPKNRTYADEQRKRKQEQQRDLERIRRQVENDRAERREKSERERAIRREIEARERGEAVYEEVAVDAGSRGSMYARTNSTSAAVGGASGTTRIQVRLLDGSALRSTFPSTTTLSDVRIYVDSNRTDGSHPYTLKVLLTPQSPRILTDADTSSTLQELELHPSSTLVMNPVQGLAAAYQQGPADAAQTVLGVMWGYVLAFLMAIVGMIRTFLGIGVRAAAEAEESLDARTEGRDGMTAKENKAAVRASGTSGPDSSSSSGIRIRTLRDQSGDGRREKGKNKDRDEQQQLYNGGGVSLVLQSSPRP